MIIRARTFEQWLKANLDREQRRQLAQYGADTGWPGLTYYSDTTALYDTFKDEIWEMLSEDADSFGQTIPQFITSFYRSGSVTDAVTFANLLVWYAAERICRNEEGE